MHKKKLYYSFKIKTNDKDENMNEFAKLLSAFVKEKGVKIQPFARYCGYDRANMYKILKGQKSSGKRDCGEGSKIYALASIRGRKTLGSV